MGGENRLGGPGSLEEGAVLRLFWFLACWQHSYEWEANGNKRVEEGKPKNLSLPLADRTLRLRKSINHQVPV